MSAPFAEVCEEAVRHYREQGWASFQRLIGADQAQELSQLILQHAMQHLDFATTTVAMHSSISERSARRVIGRAVRGDAEAISAVDAAAASTRLNDGSTALSTLSNGGLSFAADDFDVDPHNGTCAIFSPIS